MGTNKLIMLVRHRHSLIGHTGAEGPIISVGPPYFSAGRSQDEHRIRYGQNDNAHHKLSLMKIFAHGAASVSSRDVRSDPIILCPLF
jgi:hypothetical protein